MSSSRLKSLELPDANADTDVHDAHTSGNHYNSGNGLRRRHNATVDYQQDPRVEAEKKHEGETTQMAKKVPLKMPNGIPKGLTPFIHINHTDPTGIPIAGYVTPPRTQSPRPGMHQAPVSPPLPDIEEQHFQRENPRDDFERESSFNITSLAATDSGTDSLNNSGLSSIDIDYGETDEDADTIDKKGKKSGSDSEGSRFHDSNDVDDESYSLHSDMDNDSDPKAGSNGNKQKNSNLSYAIQNIQRSRRFVGKLVNNTFVMVTMIFLILVNALLMGVATSPWVYRDAATAEFFDLLDQIFLWIFTVEVAMQLYYYGPALFLDCWLVFDFIVVAISWVSYAEWGSDINSQVFRSFRIFRAFRLVTRVKPLRDLVLALGDVLPRMAAIMCLLLIFIFILAVLFTELFTPTYPMYPEDLNGSFPTALDDENYFEYFETLQMSGFALFQMMTMEWGEMCRGIMHQTRNQYFVILFLFFVCIAGFIVFNLIVAVVVEAVATTEETIRALDGIEDNSPRAKLEEAQERIELLQSHLNEMMNQQEQIQCMLEAMAGELLHLETERMKAIYRENVLRKRMNRRVKYQKGFESANFASSRAFMGGNSLHADSRNSDSNHDSVSSQTRKKKSIGDWAVKPSLTKDGSGKSLGTNRSKESSSSGGDMQQSPRRDEKRTRSLAKKKKSMASWTVRPPVIAGLKKPGLTKDSSGKSLGTNKSNDSLQSNHNSSDDGFNSGHFTRPRKIDSKARSKSAGHNDQDSEHTKKKARDNWKKMLAGGISKHQV